MKSQAYICLYVRSICYLSRNITLHEAGTGRRDCFLLKTACDNENPTFSVFLVAFWGDGLFVRFVTVDFAMWFRQESREVQSSLKP